ncbi:hypothetical protein NC651_027627 [Populus alba x Populus x berolinensis]|nr:hypothetical protein NC651_027627 [Populus alba x Populus x berolinensis]
MGGGDFLFPLSSSFVSCVFTRTAMKIIQRKKGKKPNEPRIPLGILVDGTESCGTEGFNS